MITKNPMQLKAFIKKKAAPWKLLMMCNLCWQTFQSFWKKYQRDFDYAKDISFDDACDTVKNIMDSITE